MLGSIRAVRTTPALVAAADPCLPRACTEQQRIEPRNVHGVANGAVLLAPAGNESSPSDRRVSDQTRVSGLQSGAKHKAWPHPRFGVRKREEYSSG